MSNIKFFDGISAFKPNEKAPDFVKGTISVAPSKFCKALKAWVEENPDEQYLRLDLKESKDGKYYLSVNEFKPKQPKDYAEPNQGGDFDDDIPFARVPYQF